ncbi:MAG TPA: TPM domain-containing protein, partial [Chloroflexota bacterium]
AHAARALVATDDAVRTSEQELGFATARFGEHATAPFSATLQSARAELRAAFQLRQLLDDDVSKHDAAARSRLADIRAHCAEASRLLDEQSEAFDQLQDLAARAPQLVAEVDAHVVQQAARVRHSRHVLDHLSAKYTPDALVAVVSDPDQAAQRLEFAADCLARARHELANGQSGTSAVLLQAAESAADQATDLLNGVEHMEAELTQAASALPGALREVDAEIAEATAQPADQTEDGRATLVARAEALAAEVRGQRAAGPFDALAALRDVQQADAMLDHALASARTEQTRRERARAVLDQAMLVARSSVTGSEDFIETRRGGVGATARTRLAEAQRHFQQAIGRALPDPESALTEAQRAGVLARESRAIAEQNVAVFDHAQVAAPRQASSEYGVARVDGIATVDGIDGIDGIGAVDGVARGNRVDRVGAGLSGAILGGIVIGSVIDGRSPEEGSARYGLGPGSFGGVGTRSRHSADRWF